jgi:hypothetical protein
VAVEVKRVAGIDAVEQLTRYLELLNRDPLLAPVQGVLPAQSIKPQARTLAEDRGIRCVTLQVRQRRRSISDRQLTSYMSEGPIATHAKINNRGTIDRLNFTDRGIRCVTLGYEAMRVIEREGTLS